MSDQRYPVNIRLIGLMRKKKSKMFMTSVLWSDDRDIIVYRTFRDFKKLHRQLKKRFPAERSLGKPNRQIPKFKAATKQTTKKGTNKSMNRLKFLETYFDQLLKCEPSITQSSEINQFFLPTAQDLQPDFAKDSIMIMPSEKPTDGGDPRGRGNVSQPFVTEAYRCVAPYETKDTKNRPFKVAVDETVDVLIKDKAGWWLVENANKCMAWFPAPFLDKCDNEGNTEDDSIESPEETMIYHAVKNFNAAKSDEVSLSIGAVVEVLQKSDNGWWLIRQKGKVGYVPSMYLQPYRNPRVRIAAMQNEMRTSTFNLTQLQVPEAGLFRSHSQGILLSADELEPSGRVLHSPPQLQRRKSRSLKGLATPQPRRHSAQPIIMVEKPPEDDGQSSDWDSEVSSELSFSDDSSGVDMLSVSMPSSSWHMRRCLTPDPTVTPSDRLAPSKSDPDFFKSAGIPKVPPRPHAEEILTRCTTITRKAAQSPTKNRLSPGMGLIQSR